MENNVKLSQRVLKLDTQFTGLIQVLSLGGFSVVIGLAYLPVSVCGRGMSRHVADPALLRARPRPVDVKAQITRPNYQTRAILIIKLRCPLDDQTREETLSATALVLGGVRALRHRRPRPLPVQASLGTAARGWLLDNSRTSNTLRG